MRQFRKYKPPSRWDWIGPILFGVGGLAVVAWCVRQW